MNKELRILLPLHEKPEPLLDKSLGFFLEKHGYLNGQKNSIFVPYMDFKPSRLYPLKGKLDQDWYVYFEIFNPELGVWESDKIRVNINRIKNLKDKKIYGSNLVEVCNTLLRQGINPKVIKKLPVKQSLDPGEEIRCLPIIDGLKWGLEKHKDSISHKTASDYKSMLEKIYKGILAAGYSTITVGEFKKAHLRIVMELVQKTEGISDNRYNTYIEAMTGVYKAFRKYDVFNVSPLVGYGRLEEPEPESPEPLTLEERKTIYNHFKTVNPDFLTLFLLIYHTALRPKEIVALQGYNYYEEDQAFRISPKEKVTVYGVTQRKTKTKVSREVPIPLEAFELIRKMNLNQFPSEYYIFSQNFRPGPKPIARKLATDYWRKEVKVKLGINKDMYGAKHMGMSDKLDAGVGKGAVRDQAGHTTDKMTERYVKAQQKKSHREEINEKSKPFLPKEN